MNTMGIGQSLSHTSQSPPPGSDTFRLRRAKLLVALRGLGTDEYNLPLPETRYLAYLLHDDEVLLGVVFGTYEKGSAPYAGKGLLAVTDRRILLLDKKPLLIHYDNIEFDMVSGVEYERAVSTRVVTLNTRMGSVTFRTCNNHCAKQFVQVVEDMLCAQNKGWAP
jgi:hypothetical protein